MLMGYWVASTSNKSAKAGFKPVDGSCSFYGKLGPLGPASSRAFDVLLSARR